MKPAAVGNIEHVNDNSHNMVHLHSEILGWGRAVLKETKLVTMNFTLSIQIYEVCLFLHTNTSLKYIPGQV